MNGLKINPNQKSSGGIHDSRIEIGININTIIACKIKIDSLQLDLLEVLNFYKIFPLLQLIVLHDTDEKFSRTTGDL